MTLINKIIQHDRLYPEQAAEYLGVKKSTLAVWRCSKRFNIPYYKIGSKIFYKEADLKNFIESRRVTFNVTPALPDN